MKIGKNLPIHFIGRNIKMLKFTFHLLDEEIEEEEEELEEEENDYMKSLKKDEKKRKEIIPKTPQSSRNSTEEFYNTNNYKGETLEAKEFKNSKKIIYSECLTPLASTETFQTLDTEEKRKYFKIQMHHNLKHRIFDLENKLDFKKVGVSPLIKNLEKKKSKINNILQWRDEVKQEYINSKLSYMPDYRPWIDPKLINPNFVYDFDERKDLIGEGGNSRVFKAFHKDKKKVHAVKIIQWYGDEKCLSDIMIEVDCLKNFHHPSMVDYFDFYCLYIDHSSCEFWICMEYIEKYDSLTKYVKKNAPMKLKEIALIVYQMLVVLQHLHSNEIIYRDVKSDNILINMKDQKIKLIDFGFNAKITKNKKRCSTVGTCYWMARGYQWRIL
jgi:tRNA A-37 threonylcarbamoyl transferase component Bud32